jgi:hypothetical protein
MNSRKNSFLRTILTNIHYLHQCTLMAREQVMSDQQMTGTPCNLIPALRVCSYQTVTSCVQGDTLNSWQPMNHSEMNRGLFCLGVRDPSCTKTCEQFKPWGIVAWASSVFGIPQSWRAQVKHALLLSLSPFSSSHTELIKLPQLAGAPSSRFFYWLSWLPWQLARQELPMDTPRSWWCRPTVTSQQSLLGLVRLCKHSCWGPSPSTH